MSCLRRGRGTALTLAVWAGVVLWACTPGGDRNRGGSSSSGSGGAASASSSSSSGCVGDCGSDAGVPPTDAGTNLPDASSGDASVREDAGPPCPECEFQENTPARCSDGVDNDSDSYIDCRDFECDNVSPCDIPENTTAACTDGFDNDGDGYRDCRDFDCDNAAPCNVPEDAAQACSDGYDNDGDGYTDCADFGCGGLSVCVPQEDNATACRDAADNDSDGQTDCNDDQCAALSVCSTVESNAASCADLVDNDSDGQTDCSDSDCTNVASCNVTTVRVVTYNVQSLGEPGGTQWNAAQAQLRRVDADVVTLQEVEAVEAAALQTFAAQLGYPHVFQGQISTAMAGGLTNAVLSRLPLEDSRSRSSDDISPDSNANETGRDIVVTRVVVQPGRAYLGVFTMHFKSGFEDADYVRRQVEAIRLRDAVGQYSAQHPGDAVVVTGDFNEEINESTLGRVYSQAPAGMPLSYQLGSDLSYPLTYQPFTTLTATGLSVTDPTHEDSNNHATRIPSNRRIDYLLYRGAELVGDEVYNPCRDNGVDDDPSGQWLPKTGPVPACGSESDASDHRPVFAEFRFP
ncbi:MAG: endonuclease/exonuclease/phosphatase family protein [Myxococcota bacterium]